MALNPYGVVSELEISPLLRVNAYFRLSGQSYFTANIRANGVITWGKSTGVRQSLQVHVQTYSLHTLGEYPERSLHGILTRILAYMIQVSTMVAMSFLAGLRL